VAIKGPKVVFGKASREGLAGPDNIFSDVSETVSDVPVRGI